MKSTTQDMKYRQSLIKYAEKYGVSKAARKYNKARSYIYFWLGRYDGTIDSLACQSRRPHSHPRAHSQQELKLIANVRRRNPKLGLLEFWDRPRRNGYTRPPGSLFRVMRRPGYFILLQHPEHGMLGGSAEGHIGTAFTSLEQNTNGTFLPHRRISWCRQGLTPASVIYMLHCDFLPECKKASESS